LLESRRRSVAAKTYRVDADLERVLPTSLLALQVAAVTEREVARCFEYWIGGGYSDPDPQVVGEIGVWSWFLDVSGQVLASGVTVLPVAPGSRSPRGPWWSGWDATVRPRG